MEDCQNIWSHTVILFNRNNQTLHCEKCGEKKGNIGRKCMPDCWSSRFPNWDKTKMDRDITGTKQDQTGRKRETQGQIGT